MGQFVEINGKAIHYKVEGREGMTPLVFMHSLGTDMRLWDTVIPAFTNHFRVICFDLPGHGLSDEGSASNLTGDLLTLLDYLHISAGVLIGISVSGLVAMDFATAYPERVRAIVLCDTIPKISTSQMWNERIEAVHHEGLYPLMNTILSVWFAADFAAQQPTAYRGYANMLTRTTAEGYIALCEVLRDTDLWIKLDKIIAKTLVVCGEHDTSTPPEVARKLAEALPDGRYAEISGAAHLPPIEQPDATAAAIAAFLEDM
jgi:3-oxoadipate enol-lactonase